MKRTTICLTVLLAFVTVQTTLAQSRGKKKQDPADWAPPDALVYVGITDVAKTWENIQKTAGYQMMNDPAAAEIDTGLSIAGSAIEKLQERIAEALEVSPTQLKNPFSGQFTFYLTAPPGGDPDEIEPGLVAGVGDAELMTNYYDTVVAKLKEVSRHDTDRSGARLINVFTVDREALEEGEETEDDEEDFDDFDDMGGPMLPFGGSPYEMIEEFLDQLFSAESMPESLALCLTEDQLIVAGSAEQVKAALKRTGSGPTLAGTDDHKALLKQLKPIGSVRLLVNLPRIVEMAKAEVDESDAEDMRKWLRVLGAEGLRSLVGHLRVGASSYDSKFELLFLMSGERSGLAKVLSMDNTPVTPPETVSTDAFIYTGVNLSVPKLLDDIERMIRDIDPEWADQYRAGLESNVMLGPEVNPRKDLLDHLVGPLTVTLEIAKPIGPDCVRLLVALGHRDQNAIARFFSTHSQQVMLMPRELMGTQVFDTTMPPGYSLASASNALLAGNTAAVENGLEPAPAEALAESDLWRRAARHVPEEAWGTFFMDHRKMMSAALAYAKNRDEMMGSGMELAALMLGSITESMDEDDVKQYRKLLKYTGQSIFTISTTPEGVRITLVDLKPE
ncbi:MAG: hypothetical protein KAY37_17870 [Phycisphaerae bacterium]|nr:hypothetical protein [Phycisphaerae bacterium]